jgi:uncharacterized membrane protein YqaE (UPF0057 family)
LPPIAYNIRSGFKTSDGVLKTLLVKLKNSPGEIKSFGFKIKKAVYQPGLADKLPFDVE